MSQITDQNKPEHLEAAPPTTGPRAREASTRVTPATPAASTQGRVSLFERKTV
jgi:hypothetical protein